VACETEPAHIAKYVSTFVIDFCPLA